MSAPDPDCPPVVSPREAALLRQDLLCVALTGEGRPAPDLESLLSRLMLREDRP
mgnify:CR=1 FL=1